MGNVCVARVRQLVRLWVAAAAAVAAVVGGGGGGLRARRAGRRPGRGCRTRRGAARRRSRRTAAAARSTPSWPSDGSGRPHCLQRHTRTPSRLAARPAVDCGGAACRAAVRRARGPGLRLAPDARKRPRRGVGRACSRLSERGFPRPGVGRPSRAVWCEEEGLLRGVEIVEKGISRVARRPAGSLSRAQAHAAAGLRARVLAETRPPSSGRYPDPCPGAAGGRRHEYRKLGRTRWAGTRPSWVAAGDTGLLSALWARKASRNPGGEACETILNGVSREIKRPSDLAYLNL